MLCAFAHPTASILMGLLTVFRIVYEKQWKALRFILVGYLIAMICGLTIALSFNPFEDYLSSVIFSKGYGVGSINISNLREPLLLLGILFLIGCGGGGGSGIQENVNVDSRPNIPSDVEDNLSSINELLEDLGL